MAHDLPSAVFLLKEYVCLNLPKICHQTLHNEVNRWKPNGKISWLLVLKNVKFPKPERKC